MALTSLTDIKNWFKTNLIPTQQQFYDLFDSFRHKNDKVAATDIDGLTTLLAAKASDEAFTAHTGAENAHAGLFGALRTWVESQIVGVGVSSTNLGALTPLTVIPATINVHGFATETGTYANCGGLVVPANTFAFLSRVGGVWGISKTGLDISSKVDLVRSVKEFNPFHPAITGKVGLTIDTLRNLILGVEINSITPNPALYYSIKYITRTATVIDVYLYSSTTTGNAGLINIKVFSSKEVSNTQLLIKNGTDFILINPTVLPIGEYDISSPYLVSGLSQDIFKVNNSVLINSIRNPIIDLTPQLVVIPSNYINTAGAVASNASFYYTKEFPINKDGNYYVTAGGISVGGIAIISYYDKNMAFISSINQDGSYTYLNTKLVIPTNGAYVRFCNGGGSLSFKLTTDAYTIYLNTLAVKPISLTEKVDVSNIVDFITGSYISPVGVVTANASWKYSSELTINKNGNYYLTMSNVPTGGYAIISYYDADMVYISSLNQDGSVLSMVDYKLIIPINAVYVKFSALSGVAFYLSSDLNTLYKFWNKPLSSGENQFVLPKYIDVAVNQDCNIYFDCITKNSNYNSDGQLLIYANDTVKRTQNSIKYKPTSVVATLPVTFKKTNDSLTTLFSRTTNMRTVPITGGGSVTKNILLIGDSLTANGYMVEETKRLLALNGDFTPNFIGTLVSGADSGTVKHEGRSGWKWQNYNAGVSYGGSTNAFWVGGQLDFKAYCVANGFSGIDYVIIQLGTNDVSQGTYINTPTDIAGIIAQSKTFIDTLMNATTGYPACKVAIALPAVGCPEINGYYNMNAFRRSIQLLNQAYIDTYDDGKYHANVTCLGSGLWINRWNSYPYTDQVISDRITTTERVFTNNVHPLQVGYYQWADAYYSKIRAFLNGLL